MTEHYNDLFREQLRERLRAGGDPDTMVALARIYEERDDDTVLRDYAYREWLRETRFTCGRCRRRFVVSDTEETNRWDDVLCVRCAKREEP